MKGSGYSLILDKLRQKLKKGLKKMNNDDDDETE